jgi:hypothetical protein
MRNTVLNRVMTSILPIWRILVVLKIAVFTHAHGQGTINFDSPWVFSGISYYTTYSDQSGVNFDVINAFPGANLAKVGATLEGHPGNATPHLEFMNSIGGSRYVTLSYSASPFGLVSVDLADPVAPSLSPVSIVFNGFRADGSMITQTFTVGGGGSSSFANFQFSMDFASDLVRVEIPSSAWAMDNLAYNVPEPGTAGLFLLGLAALLFRRAAT